MALTKYEEGSVRELLSISIPLMLSMLSAVVMLFVDRLLLARYSTEAMCAATNAATQGWVFVAGFYALTSIAEVFVAQFNGAGKTHKLGEPIWQMIWISLATVIFFVPLGLWGGDFFFPQSFGKKMTQDYFSMMMFFGPVYAVYAALAAFWVGRGKTTIITWLAVVANIVNACLDVVLIFGVEGVIPSLGVKGAVIATNIGIFFQVCILMVLFLRKRYRQDFGTNHVSLNVPLIRDCIRVGFPSAMCSVLEISGWAMFYRMMTAMGLQYITVASVCQSIAMLFWFCCEGLNKGALTVAGNMIGAGHSFEIPKVIKSGFKIIVFIFLCQFIGIVVLGRDLIINSFLDVSANPENAALRETLIICLKWVVVYMFFEATRFLIGGVLTAAGDTMFLMVGGAAMVWLGMVIPVKLIILNAHASVEASILLWVSYALGATLLNYGRFLTGRWKKITIVASSL